MLFGTLLSRYLLRQTLSMLALTASFGVLLFLIVELLERLASFLQHAAPLAITIKYILFRTPWYVSNILPLASLLSVLLTLGQMTRQNEVIAMRSAGVSLRQVTLAFLSIAGLTSAASFLWNEWILPPTFSLAETTRKVDIKKRDPKGLLSEQGIWVRGDDAFYQIGVFDRRLSTLNGIRVFRIDRSFQLTSVVEAESARWDGKEWKMQGVRERGFSPPSWEPKAVRSPSYRIPEPLEEFDLLSKEPEEFGIIGLRNYIEDLRSRGVNTRSYEVDLQLKLSSVFLPLVMTIVAIPFALRHPRAGSVALSFATSLAIGFCFWVAQAFTLSLARGGVLSPLIAAWLPHGIFSLAGFYYLLGVEE